MPSSRNETDTREITITNNLNSNVILYFVSSIPLSFNFPLFEIGATPRPGIEVQALTTTTITVEIPSSSIFFVTAFSFQGLSDPFEECRPLADYLGGSQVESNSYTIGIPVVGNDYCVISFFLS